MLSMPGPMELTIIFLIIALLFGAKRLPQIGEGLGKSIRNFKKAISGDDVDETKKDEIDK